jgi:hypothetical protein
MQAVLPMCSITLRPTTVHVHVHVDVHVHVR